MKTFLSALMLGAWLLSFTTLGLAGQEGLVGHWRFDAAAPSVADDSGQGQTAKVSGGKLVIDAGKAVLALDGRQSIVVPSCPELSLQPGFSIEIKVKLSRTANGQVLLFKNGQYSLRIDPPSEGGTISFFSYVDGAWEPRTSACPPTLGKWYHLVATWDGRQSLLWVNGVPFRTTRRGKPPARSDSPLVIGSTALHGGGLVGAIEYVKVYRRALLPSEILREASGRAEAAATPSATTSFDFCKGTAVGDWTAQEGATVSIDGQGLVVGAATPFSLVMNNRLNASIDRRDFVSLRMAVGKANQARLIFATTRGAGQVPFRTVPDGKPHTYVLEPWMETGWRGKLLVVGLVPSDVANDVAHVEYLRIGEEVQAEPALRIERVFTESTLPRAQRAERIVARLSNAGGAAHGATATLSALEGLAVRSPATQVIPDLTYRDRPEITWEVEATRPLSRPFRVTVSGAGVAEPVSAVETLDFHANPHLEKAAYVPPPIPAKTKYSLWTHYCPLWKQHTHLGWAKIEPWPEREPVLGWYNEGTPEVADWHIKYMLEHGISGVVYCWYRTNINGPVAHDLGHAIHDGLLRARYLPMIRFALMWENGCGQGVGSADDLLRNVLPYWIDHYFSQPSYLRIDGKPVLYVWVPSNLSGQLGGSDNARKTFTLMRNECQRRGLGGLVLVGCVGSQDKAALETLANEGWDASSAYGNSWQTPAKLTTVDGSPCAPFEGFAAQQAALWAFKRQLHLLPDITAVMMGWDVRPWTGNSFFWSNNTPEKFRDLCRQAKAAIDSSPSSGPEKRSAIFCCWNEFGEGHYIEPTRGYGFSYLDAIRDVFCEPSPEHLDIAPADVGLASPDSWYRATRQAVGRQGCQPADRARWSGNELAAWSGLMGLDNVELRDGILRGRSINRDPAFSSPPLRLRAYRYASVVAEMRVSRSGHAQLYWLTPERPWAADSASAQVATKADGQWHRYVFPVGSNEAWEGCIASLRLDPTTAEGVTVEIRSIELQ